MFLQKDGKSAASLLNRAGKILFFYILILIFTPNSTVPDISGSPLPISYGELERALVSILIPVTILVNRFSPQSLKNGYLFYIQTILQGCWISILTLCIFKGIYLFHPIPNLPIDFDFLLFFAFILFILGSLLPITPTQLSLNTTDLFNQYQALKSPTERLRDTLLTGGFFLLIFLLLQWISTDYLEIFQFLAFLSLLIGFILIFTPKKHDRSRFGSLMSTITDQAQIIDPSSEVGRRVQNFARTIQETEFQKPERVYTIPSDQMKLVSKGKTSISAKKGSIAVPTVTEKGTALVLMGKSEMETKDENQEISTKEIEGTTTIWLKPEEWDKIKLQLNPKEMSELTETELKTAGIDTITEIFEKTKKALNDLKTWRGPKGMFSSVLDSTPSKYSITETKDYSLVRLPGIYVFESPLLELVSVFGIVKVIEIKGVGQYVQVFGGFVTVLETPDYQFVQTPFVSVIETPKGELVRIFGIDIQEGEKIDLEEMRSKIIQDRQRFDSLFTKRVETLFEEDPHLLLTDSQGERMGFILGKDGFLSDTPKTETKMPSMPVIKGNKGIKAIKRIGSMKGIERHVSKHESRHKHVETEKKDIVTLATDIKESQISKELPSSEITLDLDIEGVLKEHPLLQEIDEGLTRVEDAINSADEKFLNNEISEKKHTEIINRLKIRKERLQEKKAELSDQFKPKLV